MGHNCLYKKIKHKIKWDQSFTNLLEFVNSRLIDHQRIYITFKNQQFDNQKFSDFFDALQKCNRLTALILDMEINSIQNTGVSDLAQSLEKCSNIQNLKLFLRENGIEDVGGLGCSLGKLAKLESLEIQLSQNRINNGGLGNLCRNLKNCKNLRTLILGIRDNDFTEIGVSALGSELSYCSNLQILEIEITQNEIKDIKGFCQGLKKCTEISDLNLEMEDIQIGKEAGYHLGSMIAAQIKLKNLKINAIKNNIEYQFLSSFAKEISQNLNLTNLKLILAENQIQSQGVTFLATNLAKCKNLAKLNINMGRNYIGYSGFRNLFSKLVYGTGLQELTINLEQNNFLDCGDYKPFNNSNTSNLQKLILNLSLARLNAKIISNLCSYLASIHSLSYLSLQLRGSDITDDVVLILASNLQNFINIESLKLEISEGKIKKRDQVFNDLGFNLIKCTNLKKLSLKLMQMLLDDNDLTNLSSHFIIQLQFLSIDLSRNYVSGKGLADLGQYLIKVAHLKGLQLRIVLLAPKNDFKSKLDKMLMKFKKLVQLNNDQTGFNDTCLF